MSVPNSTAGVAFKKAYIASRDLRLQPLFDDSIDPAVRRDAAYALALKGVVVDFNIDVLGADPYLMMQLRSDLGLKWTPSALQPSLEVALVGSQSPNPPFWPYDPNTEPSGGCPTITDVTQFTPVAVPSPAPIAEGIDPTPRPGDKLIGGAKGGSFYDLSDLARHKALNDGFVWTLEGDGHVYMMHVVSFGVKIFERKS